MSLNFVSSAVLSSTDGVSHNEERPIESAEAESLRKRDGTAKPLFEQLQYNRDKQQEQYDDIGKAMRGSRTLDDEDCAHLDSVEAVRAERERRMQQSIEEEMMGFKAARADLSLSRTISVTDELQYNINGKNGEPREEELLSRQAQQQKKSEMGVKSVMPVIVGRKRRRTQTDREGDSGDKTASSQKDDQTARSAKPTRVQKQKDKAPDAEHTNGSEDSKIDAKVEASATDSGLGGLLGCYGSNDDSDWKCLVAGQDTSSKFRLPQLGKSSNWKAMTTIDI